MTLHTLYGQLGYALYHSLWQCSLAALLLFLVLPFLQESTKRYLAACLALAASLAAFVASMVIHPSMSQPTAERISNQSQRWITELVTSNQIHLTEDRILPWLVPLWMMGVLLFQLRCTLALIATQRLRKQGVCLAPLHWRNQLPQLASRLALSRTVTLLESSLANTPSVIGYLRPVILVPVGLLASMPPDQVDAILLHELAHIRRNDYLVNLLQTVAEGLLYYHPAIWWMADVIRKEREHCCDDLATAALGGNVHQYASALVALEQSRWKFETLQTAAMAATGGGSGLMQRIQRLLYPKQASRWSLSAVPITVITIAIFTAWQSSATPPQGPLGPYRLWVNEDVAYIISPAEKLRFESLRTDEEREAFIVQFWKMLDPTPDTVENERKEEHYRRIAYANSRFVTSKLKGWKTDRGRVYIIYGPSDEIEAHPSGRNGGPPQENWLYHFIEGIGNRVIVSFVDKDRTGEYTWTQDPANKKQ